MKYILDTANLDKIKHFNEYFPISGVTTNPSIISRENTDFLKLVKEIRTVIGEEKSLHVQTMQTSAEKIVEEAKYLQDYLKGNFYLKVPVCEEGIKATKMLKKEGIKVTMTVIFTAQQALMAAAAGASYVAPYVNRLDNIMGDGIKVVNDIQTEFELSGTGCEILAASFKNCEQVNKCALAGCGAATVSPDIMAMLVKHPMTDVSIQGFKNDWQKVYGNKNILDF